MHFELQKEEEIEMQQAVARWNRQEEASRSLLQARDQYKLYQEQILEATVAQQQFADATLALTQSCYRQLI